MHQVGTKLRSLSGMGWFGLALRTSRAAPGTGKIQDAEEIMYGEKIGNSMPPRCADPIISHILLDAFQQAAF